MARKTVNVNDLVVTVNEMCRLSTCSRDVRQGAINVLDRVLHSTDNYRGFKYLNKTEVPAGELPGINFECTEGYDNKFKNTDPTRVYYFFA
jgi:hypothetical protein